MSDYSSTYPTQSPTFAFDAKAGKLDSRISYSRSSTGTYMSNEKALNSENLLLQSQDFDTTWVKGSSPALTASQTAPDGTSSAWLFSLASGAVVRAGVYQDWTPTANTEYTLVTHLKAGTASHGYVSIRTNSGDYYAGALLDFSAGTISVTSAGMTSATGTVTALGSSWYKVTVTATSGTNLSSPQITIGISDGSAVGENGRPATWTAAGTETMYAWGAQLSSTNSKAYDSPTTTQISRSYSPLLKTAAADEPRFEYAADGQSVGTALGLLVESQATSLITYSEDFSNSFWDKTRLSIDSNVAVSPDGTLTASAMRVDGTAASTHRMRFTYATGGATAQTFSIFAKAGSKSWVALNFDSSGGAFDASIAYFNLASGTTGTVDSGITAKISACGNGWHRCSITRTALASATGQIELYVGEADNDVTIDGNSYDHILCWGAMIEANTSAPSSYIKSNSGSSTSRAADSCSLVSAPLLDNGSGGLVVEYDMRNASTTSYVLQTARSSGATNNDGATIFNEGLFILGQGSNTRIGSTTSNVFHKVAASWESGSQKISRDGSAVTEDTTTVVPQSGTDKLHIGTRQDGNASVNGHIRNIAIYSEPLTSTNLTTLSQL
jgi:hypothetical protein